MSPPPVLPEDSVAAVEAGFALGMAVREAGQVEGAIPAEIEAKAAEIARKEVARQFTDLLLRPRTAPAAGRR